jgi:hypothetical protein
MHKNTMLIILSFPLIFLLLFPWCQPSTMPDISTGTISGQAALPGSTSKDITGYTPIPGATLTIIDAQGNTHTTLTDSNGFYSFDNISVKANTIIIITKDTPGAGKIVFMEVVPQALSPEENFYAGIADAESTALALVIEALINLGQLQEEIDLEAIISASGFAQLEETVRQAQSSHQDILTLSSIITQAEAIADYLLNPPQPAPLPSPEPTPIRYVATDGDNSNDGSESAPWQTIQYALDNIPTLGTILVNDGIYKESIIFPFNKEIILKSINGESFTFIQGYNSSSAIMCNSFQEGTTLEGFTISHLAGDTGRGVDNYGYLMIKNCIISNNSADDGGGGILNWGLLTILSSTISNNYTSPGSGGGISNKSSLTITSSTISDNSASLGSAGGIANNGTLTIASSTISYNHSNSGGGIDNREILKIASSTISDNSAKWTGGGIINFGALNITSSTISNNNAAINYGGGIYLETENNVTIGGNGDFNTFSNNTEGSDISADQHIWLESVGDCHWDYLDNDYSPAEITSYKFLAGNNSLIPSIDIEGDINPTDRTISLTVPSGTDLTNLIATFELVTGASAESGTVLQVSGSTPNNFSSPMKYSVFKTIEPGKNTEWTVTVTVNP